MGAEEWMVGLTAKEVKEIRGFQVGRGNALPFKEVQLWCVMGIPQTLYDNKLRALIEARLAFPNEDADKRYSRVSFKTFYEEV